MVRTHLNLRFANSIDVSHPALFARGIQRTFGKASFIADGKYIVVNGAVGEGALGLRLNNLPRGRTAGMSAADLYRLTALAGGGSLVALT